MGDLTKNISRNEIECHCGCGMDTMDWETIEVVQEACDNFARELGVDKVTAIITSGARCMEHNLKPEEQGGAGSTEKSYHPKCRAIDFKIVGVKPKDLYMYLCEKYVGKYGLGLYKNFVHVDSRKRMARW